MYSGGYIAFVVFAFFVVIGISAFVAGKMNEIAHNKGYDDSIHAWAMCFWLGWIGYIYVLALPDLIARQNQQDILSALSSGNSQANIYKDKLPEL